MYQLCEQILIFFGRNVTNKLSNQKTVYFVTSNNLCFYTNLQNGEMRKLHFALKLVHCQNSTSCCLVSSILFTHDSCSCCCMTLQML